MNYRVRNWERFQHYKDRSPPWIRLYKGLLDDYEFHQLPDASRALAPMMWLLASENKDPNSGVIDGPDERIAFRLRMNVSDLRKAIKPLLDKEFIECSHDASDELADLQHLATPETETETDSTETEKKASTGSRLLIDVLPEEWLKFCQDKRPDLDANEVFVEFKDYWAGIPGQRGRKLDWFATWRNRVRDKKQPPKGQQHGKHSEFDKQDYYAGTEGFDVT